MKLLVFTMFGQVLQQNIRVKSDFMAGGPVHVLTMEFAICIIRRKGNDINITTASLVGL